MKWNLTNTSAAEDVLCPVPIKWYDKVDYVISQGLQSLLVPPSLKSPSLPLVLPSLPLRPLSKMPFSSSPHLRWLPSSPRLLLWWLRPAPRILLGLSGLLLHLGVLIPFISLVLPGSHFSQSHLCRSGFWLHPGSSLHQFRRGTSSWWPFAGSLSGSSLLWLHFGVSLCRLLQGRFCLWFLVLLHSPVHPLLDIYGARTRLLRGRSYVTKNKLHVLYPK